MRYKTVSTFLQKIRIAENENKSRTKQCTTLATVILKCHAEERSFLAISRKPFFSPFEANEAKLCA